VFYVGSAQRLYKESRLKLFVSSEIVNGSAGRQSEERGPGQSSTVWSRRLGSTVLEE
jgi:hypothetical protein